MPRTWLIGALAACALAAGLALGLGRRRAPTATTPDRPGLHVSTRGNKVRLWVHAMRRDGSAPRRLTTGDGMELDAAASRDGTQVVFAAAPDLGVATNSNIFVMDADGSHRRQLTHTGAKAVSLSPQFSPDGRRIVYSVATMRDGTPPQLEVLLIPVAGGEPRKIAEGTLPAFSPDGRRILFTAFDWGQSFAPRLVSVDTNGGDARDLSRGEDKAMMGAYSPDGRRIAYIGSQGSVGKPDIFVMNADGTDKRPLTHTEDMFEISPVWAPDGQEIYFARIKENKEQLRAATLAIHPDGTGLRALTPYDTSNIPGSGAGFFLLLITGQPGSLFE